MIDKINTIKKFLTELDEEIFNYVSNSPDLIQACEYLAEMNLLKRDVGLVYDTFSYAMIGIMGDQENVALANGAQIEKKSAYDRKGWDHKSLGNAVADKIVKLSIDMQTGEVLKTTQEMIADVLTYCAPSYWRIKELNKIGINADNYCEVGELKTSIIVRKAKDQ
jgi:hypothetical protein